MRFDTGVEQLIGAQPEQVQQDGVDLVGRPVGRAADHRVE
jgi:hypothetical protein